VPEVCVDAVNDQGHRIGQLFLCPRSGKVDSYLDWRSAFVAVAQSTSLSDLKDDLEEAALIACDVWEKVVEYIE
jgi:hypothetical protein